MKTSPGQWAPWIWDPDPPEKPMTEAQLQRMADGLARLMAKHKQPDPEEEEEEEEEELQGWQRHREAQRRPRRGYPRLGP